MNKLLLTTLFAVSSLIIFPSYAANCTEDGIIEVTGVASVKTKPDVAVLMYKPFAQNKDAKKARNQVEQIVSALISEAKGLGVKKEQILSDSLSIYPKYHYENKKGQVFDGYVARRDVTFRIEDFSLIDKITTIAVKNGITEIQGFHYEIKDSSKYKLEADAKAIEDAKNKAKLLAEGFGVKIKKACSLRFNQNEPVVYRHRVLAAKMNAVAMDAAPKAEEYSPDEQTIESTVYATFAIE